MAATTSTISTYTVTASDVGYRLGFYFLARLVGATGTEVGGGGSEVIMNQVVAPAP